MLCWCNYSAAWDIMIHCTAIQTFIWLPQCQRRDPERYRYNRPTKTQQTEQLVCNLYQGYISMYTLLKIFKGKVMIFFYVTEHPDHCLTQNVSKNNWIHSLECEMKKSVLFIFSAVYKHSVFRHSVLYALSATFLCVYLGNKRVWTVIDIEIIGDDLHVWTISCFMTLAQMKLSLFRSGAILYVNMTQCPLVHSEACCIVILCTDLGSAWEQWQPY